MSNPVATDLYVVHPDGSGLTAITSSEDGLFSFGPVWSPGTAKLLFVRGPHDFESVDLWTVNVDGMELGSSRTRPRGTGGNAWAPSPETGS